ncbi:unnamed protein product [Symbiodinium pilosum]|uniref:Uncharacterized protein n=1 Tax=Symbiodinium pilosum TaxID=2952 RepID=A0A812LYR8_SYMPI|nr:unnamed protein product [Symbiodinium pilosum]
MLHFTFSTVFASVLCPFVQVAFFLVLSTKKCEESTKVTLTGIRNGILDDVVNTLKEAYEHVKDCLDESIVMRFAMWIRFVVDVDQCTYEASVNSGSSQLIVSACGHLPLTATLFRGPHVDYQNNGFTFSSCALGVACADLRFENKASDCQFDVWDIKVKARTENVADISTSWVTILSNVTLREQDAQSFGW